MKLYLIRHGKTEYNISSIHHYDHIGLSKVGIQQAEKIAREFSQIPVNIFYSSNLERARQTAAIINKAIKKNIMYSDFLNEIKNPSEIIGKKRGSEEVKKVHDIIAKNHHDANWHYSDEENFTEFKNRVVQFLRLLEKISNESSVLAVTHGGTIRILTLFMLFGEGFTPENFQQFKTSLKIDNAGVTVCEKESGKNWVIKTFNNCSHLDEKS